MKYSKILSKFVRSCNLTFLSIGSSLFKGFLSLIDLFTRFIYFLLSFRILRFAFIFQIFLGFHVPLCLFGSLFFLLIVNFISFLSSLKSIYSFLSFSSVLLFLFGFLLLGGLGLLSIILFNFPVEQRAELLKCVRGF